jgi:hypothetical protein
VLFWLATAAVTHLIPHVAYMPGIDPDPARITVHADRVLAPVSTLRHFHTSI